MPTFGRYLFQISQRKIPRKWSNTFL